MDPRPSDEQLDLIDVLHQFAETRIRPHAPSCEEAGEVATPIRTALHDMGVLVGVSEEYGGQGHHDVLTRVLVAEELSWGDPGTAFALLAPGACADAIDRAGTPAQRTELLPALAGGHPGALALVELEARCDPYQLDATATVDRAGAVLGGTKYAVAAADAAHVLLFAAGGPAGSHPGPTLWRVPDPGLSLHAVLEDKLGLRAARTFRVCFDGVEVPAGERIGGPEADPEPSLLALLGVRLVTAGIALGLGRAAVEYATSYARERVAFGRPIGAFQAVSFSIADRATDLEAARLLVWEGACALDAERPPAGSSLGPAIVAACAHATAAALAAADDAVQILGGHGYMKDHPVERWYRDAMTLAALA